VLFLQVLHRVFHLFVGALNFNLIGPSSDSSLEIQFAFGKKVFSAPFSSGNTPTRERNKCCIFKKVPVAHGNKILMDNTVTHTGSTVTLLSNWEAFRMLDI